MWEVNGRNKKTEVMNGVIRDKINMETQRQIHRGGFAMHKEWKGIKHLTPHILNLGTRWR
jgi:hypothetical protein